MVGIWTDGSEGWELVAASGFPDEASLHRLVAAAPQVLPLSGSPRLAVLGTEVQLGAGYADILAIEDSGRPVVIEVKLGRNSEARRAVVAQVLAYAAHLQALDVEGFREAVAGKFAAESVEAAVRAIDQDGSVDFDDFQSALEAHLSDGSFRLVLVLDEAPSDLVRLIGYLESVTTDRLTIDLVTVASYEVGGRTVLLPQRVDPERVPTLAPPRRRASAQTKGELTTGSGAFETSVADATGDAAETFRRLIAWAQELETAGLVSLSTYRGRVGGGHFCRGSREKVSAWLRSTTTEDRRTSRHSAPSLNGWRQRPFHGSSD